MLKKLLKSGDKKNTLLWVMLSMAVIGLIGSFVLSIETINHLKNPDAELSCSISPLINCATVMDSWQAEIFGFPNILIGLMGFAVLITIIVVALAGAKLPRWIVMWTQLAIMGAFVFLGWLMYSSLFVIQVLCPWCVVVAFSTIVLLWASTRWSLKQNAFNFSKKTNKSIQKFIDQSFDTLIFAVIFVGLALYLFARYVLNIV